MFPRINKMVCLKIAAWNSTVNGRNAKVQLDAKDWLNGWKNLNFEKAYTDGHPCMNFPFGSFGAGRKKGFSCGEYLHVPLRRDSRRYRVRCRFQPGFKYKKQTILSVQVTQRNKQWFWELGLK